MRFFLTTLFLALASTTHAIHHHSLHEIQQSVLQQEGTLVSLSPIAYTEIGALSAAQPFTTATVLSKFCLAEDAPNSKNPKLNLNEIRDQDTYLNTKNCDKKTYKTLNKELVESLNPKPTHWGLMILDVGTTQFICHVANYVPGTNGDKYVTAKAGGATHTEKHCLNAAVELLFHKKVTLNEISEWIKKPDDRSTKATLDKIILGGSISPHKGATIKFSWCNQKTMCGACEALYKAVRTALARGGYTVTAPADNNKLADALCPWDGKNE